MKTFFRTAPLAMIVTAVAAAQMPLPTQLSVGREQLAAHQYAAAGATFSAFAKTHESDARAWQGLGEAEIGLHQYDDAELNLRHAASLEPQRWVVHKDLVLVEAKLGRWEEFDRERAILRSARERNADDITRRESDLIDTFSVGGHTWNVREYFEPMGRSQTRYNFERFDDGRVAEYISLEPQTAAATALQRDAQVRIGEAGTSFGNVAVWSLNWYTDAGHGTIRTYAHGEPSYETLRADVLRWLRAQPSAQPHRPR